MICNTNKLQLFGGQMEQEIAILLFASKVFKCFLNVVSDKLKITKNNMFIKLITR